MLEFSWLTICFGAIIAVILLTIVYSFIDSFLRQDVVSGLTEKHILITGCDSGFGEQACLLLDMLGCRVIAACLMPDGAARLRQRASSRLTAIVMNITDERSVREAFIKVESILGPDKGLDRFWNFNFKR